jgi:hypothetical protein
MHDGISGCMCSSSVCFVFLHAPWKRAEQMCMGTTPSQAKGVQARVQLVQSFKTSVLFPLIGPLQPCVRGETQYERGHRIAPQKYGILRGTLAHPWGTPKQGVKVCNR